MDDSRADFSVVQEGGEGRAAAGQTVKSRKIFFWDIFTGPKRAFLTFQAELKKVLDGWIRPKMADSRADFSFGQEEGEDHQAGAAAAKNRKISNCK